MAHETLVFIHGEGDDMDLGIELGDEFGGFDAVFEGHPQVHKDHVGLGDRQAVEQFLAVLGFLYELDVVEGSQGEDHPFPENLMVVGDGYLDYTHRLLFFLTLKLHINFLLYGPFVFLVQLDGHFVIGLGKVLLEKYLALQHFEAALDVLETETDIALVEFFEVGLGEAAAVVVHADEESLAAGVLGEVDEAGVAVFEDVVDEFLDHAEDDEFVFRFHAFAVVVEAGARVHAAGAADFLEQVVDGRFQSEILEGGGHEAVGDIADQLDGVVDDLFGVVDALELGCAVEIYEVVVEVEAGGGEEGAGVVVQVGGDALAFFFLEADGGVEQGFLLVLFHGLELVLVADHLALVEADEYDEADGEGEHPDGAKEEHHGNSVIGGQGLQ